MPRPLNERDKPLSRVNVLLDVEALDIAKKKAIDENVRNIPLAGNTSKFIRWLVEKYIEQS